MPPALPEEMIVAKRRFELPGIHELSKEQEKAIRLPLEGRHLIIGGPGTGKTVVTLLRLRRYLQQSREADCIFLVYNHLLHATAQQLFGKKMKSATWTSWFFRLYRARLKTPVPTIEADSGFQPIDWPSVIQNITERSNVEPPEPLFIFIDEGQDMPPEFYSALKWLGYEHFFVVADQNQAITADNSSRQQLQNELAIKTEDVIELTHNYRNALPVARLAGEFYPDDPATPPVDLPSVPGSTQTPVLIEYGPGCRLNFDGVCTRLLKMTDRDPARLIGVISPTNDVRIKYLETLRRQVQSGGLSFDNHRPRIGTYAAGEKSNIRFDEGGIFLINAKSCKGLEFDTVFIADVNAFHCFPSIRDEIKRLFYVMTARAIERVIILKEHQAETPLDAILPDDPDTLRHWR